MIGHVKQLSVVRITPITLFLNSVLATATGKATTTAGVSLALDLGCCLSVGCHVFAQTLLQPILNLFYKIKVDTLYIDIRELLSTVILTAIAIAKQ